MVTVVLWVKLPDVAVMVSEYVPVGVRRFPPPAPAFPPPHAAQRTTSKKVAVSANPAGGRALKRLLARRANNVKPTRKAIQIGTHRLPWLGGSAQGATGAKDRAVVVTVRVAVTASLPFGATELGEIVQLASLGVPEHVNATLWLNPAAH